MVAMIEVPYVKCRERGKRTPVALYGSCRVCSVPFSGEDPIVCQECQRDGAHLAPSDARVMAPETFYRRKASAVPPSVCGLCALESGITIGTNGWSGTRPQAHAPGCAKDKPVSLPMKPTTSGPSSFAATMQARKEAPMESENLAAKFERLYKEERERNETMAATLVRQGEMLDKLATKLADLETVPANIRMLADNVGKLTTNVGTLETKMTKMRGELVDGFKGALQELVDAVAATRPARVGPKLATAPRAPERVQRPADFDPITERGKLID